MNIHKLLDDYKYSRTQIMNGILNIGIMFEDDFQNSVSDKIIKNLNKLARTILRITFLNPVLLRENQQVIVAAVVIKA